MHACELFSIRKSKENFDALSKDFQHICDSLAEQGVEVRFKTDVSADPKKLSEAAMSSVKVDAAELYIFSNALNTSDSSSFKSLFYELVSELESALTVDEEHAGSTPKLKIFSLGDMGNGYKGYCFRSGKKVFIALPYASLTGKDNAALLCEALAKATDVLTEKRDQYPDGIAYLTGKEAAAKGQKKENFFMSFIPHKGDTGSDVVRKIIVLIALVAFVYSAVYLINYQKGRIDAKNDISEIQQIAHGNSQNSDDPDAPEAEPATTSDGKALPSEDWDALKKVNNEIVGWITLKGTPIDYPVLLHKGDDISSQYYLSHSVKKEWSDYGTIFVDYRSTQGTKSKNVILHGHNMLDGSMFHELVNFSNGLSPNLDYYKKHPIITFNTPDGDAKWKIISVFKASTLFEHGEFFNYMQGKFNSDAEFMNFVYNVRIRSLYNTPVTINENDQILTLSTCSYEYKNFRTVVVARKVRPGEDETVDVSKATANSSPYYPEIYYGLGNRPDALTFKTAYAQGEVKWYDGTGDPQKLEGSEDLTDTISANESRLLDEDGVPVAGYTYYFVYYRNLDKSQIAAYTVRKGNPVPVPSIIPTYEDANYTYTFVEWNRDIQGVDFNHLNTSITIYPRYNATRKVQPTEPPTDPPTEPEPEAEPETHYENEPSGEDEYTGDEG